MRRFVLCWLVGVLCASSASAEDKIVSESWDAAYLEGVKAGHYHTLVREGERAGKKVLTTTLTMDLKIRRYNSVVPLRMASSTTETTDGNVVALSLTQFLDRGKFVQKAEVVDGQLQITVPGTPIKRTVPWSGKAIGLAKQDRIFKDRQVKTGDTFTYQSYELALLNAITIHAKVKGLEEVDLLRPADEGEKPGVKHLQTKLLRVELRSDKIEVGGNPIQLPMQVVWLDKNLRPIRSQMELPGMGKVTMYRTTKKIAQEGGAAPALLPDLGLNTILALDKVVPDPHDKNQVVFRITYTGDDEEEDPSTLFERDDRQSASKVSNKVIDLTVQAQRKPPLQPGTVAPKKEYLSSSHFLDSNNAKVKAFAAKAVGEETDPWTKAQRIEKWVHAHMRGSSDVGFATASQVADELRGDCRQHAMLSAAMCRAVGVPSRTALGLVYGRDFRRGPMLVFHMWTEVLVNGKWVGLDATLGKGSIGPMHLKISDHSWHDTQTLAPLLSASRVMGKVKAEVRSVK